MLHIIFQRVSKIENVTNSRVLSANVKSYFNNKPHYFFTFIFTKTTARARVFINVYF